MDGCRRIFLGTRSTFTRADQFACILRSLLLVLFLAWAAPAFAGGPFVAKNLILVDDSVEVMVENERVISSALAVLLGPFAAHRIYLGTTPKVAIIYGVTFGGFGILVLLDLGHLLFTHDLAAYRNNERVFMWGTPKEQLTPR